MKSVVITGVSTGIGRAATKVLIDKGIHVFGSVRKSGDAEKLSTEFGTHFTPLLFDVTDEISVRKAAEIVGDQLKGETLYGLVNNAGIAIGGPLMHLAVSDYRRQLEVNLIGPLIVTQAFLPLLGAKALFRGSPGRIINISSVAGKISSPFLGPYSASKHGLEAFSESLRRELMIYGIDVIIIAPGAVATPIWDKAEEADIAAYEETDYASPLKKFRDQFIKLGRRGYAPERVGEVIWKALTVKRPQVRYAVVPQALVNWFLPLALPRRLLDKLIAARLDMESKA